MFTANRRLQTRILALIKDLKMTVAALNRPTLIIFVDFLTAFDRMWYPTLMRSMEKLDMSLQLRKWIFNWLRNRKMFINHGHAKLQVFKISVGNLQVSVLAAFLFRLHICFLPSYFSQIMCYVFADDLTILIKGALESRFSDNLKYIQDQAQVVFKSLEGYADDHILLVNIKKDEGYASSQRGCR